MKRVLTETAVADGHGLLLQRLRGFDAWAGVDPDLVDANALATSVSLLRNELLAHAGRQAPPAAPGGDSRKTASLIRAFLAAEVAAFDRAADELLRLSPAGDARGWREATARLVRLAHRIEALLEVAALNGEDGVLAPVTASAAGAATDEESRGPEARVGIGRARPLRDDEIERFVRRHRWGVLSTTVDGQPYAVPVAYGYLDGRFYVVTGPGRKARNLDANPAVCFTVVEVEDHGARWCSVVAIGTARWVEGLRERLVALDALRRQHGRMPVRSLKDVARLAGSRVVCITPSEMTGRIREG